MKNTLISALTVLVASTAIVPVASAVEPASFNMQATRMEALDARTKANDPIKNIQEARLTALDERTKANDPVENIQEARLTALDERTKAVIR